MSETVSEAPTAAILVIGDEVLSGRTRDKNIGYIAETLTASGIDLKEARIVPDVGDEIIAALDALRARYTYVFTTGGIGPTHDDITADAVAKAFGVPIDIDPRALAVMRERYHEEDLNAARLRMARIPEGADLIDNPVSKAPGFRIGNVIVMAGVPMIMHRMLDNVLPTLGAGTPVLAREIPMEIKEGDLAPALGQIQAKFPDVAIGSYPQYAEGVFSTRVVVRSRDEEKLKAAAEAVEALVANWPAKDGAAASETGKGFKP